jgi:hypothetical protein
VQRAAGAAGAAGAPGAASLRLGAQPLAQPLEGVVHDGRLWAEVRGVRVRGEG